MVERIDAAVAMKQHSKNISVAIDPDTTVEDVVFSMQPVLDDPICERCLQEDELATHILCDCEAIAYLRFRHLGCFFMEPSDFYDAPIIKVLHFIRSVGLIKG
jgi:hypothetical protein